MAFGVLWYLGYCEYPTIGRFGGPKTDPTKTWYPGPQTVPRGGDLRKQAPCPVLSGPRIGPEYDPSQERPLAATARRSAGVQKLPLPQYAALWLPGQWAHWQCRQNSPAPKHEPEIPACTPISVKKAAEAQRRLRMRALSPSLARRSARSAIGPSGCCMLASTFKLGHQRTTGASRLRTRHTKCLVAWQDAAARLAGAQLVGRPLKR